MDDIDNTVIQSYVFAISELFLGTIRSLIASSQGLGTAAIAVLLQESYGQMRMPLRWDFRRIAHLKAHVKLTTAWPRIKMVQ
jgi:hypothetical protein